MTLGKLLFALTHIDPQANIGKFNFAIDPDDFGPDSAMLMCLTIMFIFISMWCVFVSNFRFTFKWIFIGTYCSYYACVLWAPSTT